MNRILTLLLCIFISNTLHAQELFSATKGEVAFLSKAAIEDIKAENKQPASIINLTNNEIAVIIPVRNFHFAKELMEEHFNEKYMECEKFPMASFKGTVQDSSAAFAEGDRKVTAKGILTIHGVEKEVTLTGTLTRHGDVITLDSEFKVALKDYNITIPKLLFQNIAEVIDVHVSLEYKPLEKKTPGK